MSHVSKSLRLLTKNERCEQIAQVAHQKWAMWANCSGYSPKMSDLERIAQVAHQTWAKEQITHFIELIPHLLIFSQKKSDSLRKQMSEFPALGGCNRLSAFSYQVVVTGFKHPVIRWLLHTFSIQLSCGCYRLKAEFIQFSVGNYRLTAEFIQLSGGWYRLSAEFILLSVGCDRLTAEFIQ